MMQETKYDFIYRDLTKLRHEYLSSEGIIISGKSFSSFFIELEGWSFLRLQVLLQHGVSVRSILGVDRFSSASIRRIGLVFYFVDGSFTEVSVSNLTKEMIPINWRFKSSPLKSVKYVIYHDPILFNHPSLDERKYVLYLRSQIQEAVDKNPTLSLLPFGIENHQSINEWNPPKSVPLDFWAHFMKFWTNGSKDFMSFFKEYQREKILNLESKRLFSMMIEDKKALIWKEDREYLQDKISFDHVKSLGYKDMANRYKAYLKYKKCLKNGDYVSFWNSL